MKSKKTSCTLGTLAALYCLPINTPVVAFAPSMKNHKKSRSSLPKTSLQAATSNAPKHSNKDESQMNLMKKITATTTTDSRRTFIGEAIKATVTASGLTVGMFLNADMDGHLNNCACEDCSGNNSEVMNHAPGCQCNSCVKFFLHGPLSASAYETKDDDGNKRSADYYAQVIQVGFR